MAVLESGTKIKWEGLLKDHEAKALLGQRLPDPRLSGRSALRHLQTLEPMTESSALPPKADIQTSGPNVRLVPEADIKQRTFVEKSFTARSVLRLDSAF